MRAIVTFINFRLKFPSGEFFVDSADLHNTTFTSDTVEATVYRTRVIAQERADAMARTQGVRLVVDQFESDR